MTKTVPYGFVADFRLVLKENPIRAKVFRLLDIDFSLFERVQVII
jgi:hypothetical protein